MNAINNSQGENKPKALRRSRVKALPAPRTRYYVGEPVVVLPLAAYERLANHMSDVAMLDRLTQNQQAAVKQRHSLILKETRADIKAAKQYYRISSTQSTEPRLAE